MDPMTPSGADPTPRADELADDSLPGPTAAGDAPDAGSAASTGRAGAAAAMMPTDATSRMITGAGLATAIIALIGVPLSAWRLDYFGMVMIVAGLVAAGVAWAGSTGMVRIDALPGRDIELGAGIVAAVLSVLNVLERLFDLGQLDQRGGLVALILTLALAVAALALFAGVVRRWTSPREVLVIGDRGTRLAYAGVGLVMLGWLGNVTIGVWNFSAGVGVLTIVLLCGIVLRWASDPASKRLPIAGAWIAVVLAVVATLLGLNHLMGFAGNASDFGPLDWLLLLLYLAGVAMALVGSVWTAYERTMDAQERSNIGTGDLG
jgi:hypothetical protein